MNAMLRKQGIRADDMPLVGRILKESKGKYAVQLTFKKTSRHYSDELVFANSVKLVKAHILKMYPSVKFKR